MADVGFHIDKFLAAGDRNRKGGGAGGERADKDRGRKGLTEKKREVRQRDTNCNQMGK